MVDLRGTRMSCSTPFFQAFGPLLFSRPARQAMAKLGRLNSLEELYSAFGDLFPDKLIEPAEQGANSRSRTFSGRVTFWAFAAQILSPGSSCREIVRRVEAWWEHREGGRQAMSNSTSAYCQARASLAPEALELIAGHLSRSLEANSTKEECWLGGRSVKIVDGTGLSMPDTPENQAVWPQSSEQKAGCGFPMMKLVGLFSLSSGAMLAGATGNRHVHERCCSGISGRSYARATSCSATEAFAPTPRWFP